jgi:excisionase family DNA binding protein
MIDDANNAEPILLTASQAAELLQVSEKTLWNHTAPRGNQIPSVRFGKTLRYSRAALEQWIVDQQVTPRDGANGVPPPIKIRGEIRAPGATVWKITTK